MYGRILAFSRSKVKISKKMDHALSGWIGPGHCFQKTAESCPARKTGAFAVADVQRFRNPLILSPRCLDNCGIANGVAMRYADD